MSIQNPNYSHSHRDEYPLIAQCEATLYAGNELKECELKQLLANTPDEALYDLAHRITEYYRGQEFDTCSILSAKVGNCSENCKWCAQSVHYKTNIEYQSLISLPKAARYAHKLAEQKVRRYSLVGSGKALNNHEIELLASIYNQIHNEYPNLQLCASLGLLHEEQLATLKAAGVTTYHCNLESAPSFFPTVCSSHTQAQKEATIAAARRVGMQICCGGIIGMGETLNQRIEFAYYLRAIRSLSIPINILQPIKGTPLETISPLSETEILTAIAIFRLVNPQAYLRFSGGRMQLSPAGQAKAIYIGINAAITGDFLTTTGQNVATDLTMITACGKLNSSTNWELT